MGDVTIAPVGIIRKIGDKRVDEVLRKARAGAPRIVEQRGETWEIEEDLRFPKETFNETIRADDVLRIEAEMHKIDFMLLVDRATYLLHRYEYPSDNFLFATAAYINASTTNEDAIAFAEALYKLIIKFSWGVDSVAFTETLFRYIDFFRRDDIVWYSHLAIVADIRLADSQSFSETLSKLIIKFAWGSDTLAITEGLQRHYDFYRTEAVNWNIDFIATANVERSDALSFSEAFSYDKEYKLVPLDVLAITAAVKMEPTYLPMTVLETYENLQLKAFLDTADSISIAEAFSWRRDWYLIRQEHISIAEDLLWERRYLASDSFAPALALAISGEVPLTDIAVLAEAYTVTAKVGVADYLGISDSITLHAAANVNDFGLFSESIRFTTESYAGYVALFDPANIYVKVYKNGVVQWSAAVGAVVSYVTYLPAAPLLALRTFPQTRSLEDGSVVIDVTTDNGAFSFGSSDSLVYKTSTGKVARVGSVGWATTFPDAIRGLAVARDMSAVYIHISSTIYKLDGMTGAIVWSKVLGGDPTTASLALTPAEDKLVYADSSLTALLNASDGTLIWSVNTGGGVADVGVFATQQHIITTGTLYVLDITDGSVLLTGDNVLFVGSPPLDISDDELYVYHATGTSVKKYSLTTYNLVWEAPLSASDVVAIDDEVWAVVGDDIVVLNDADGSVNRTLSNAALYTPRATRTSQRRAQY